MRIIHNTLLAGREAYGVGEVVRSLARAQAAQMDVTIVCQDMDEGEFIHEREAGVKMRLLPRRAPMLMGFHPAYLMDHSLKRYDIVHQHNSWMGNSVFSLRMDRTGVPVVYAPHGTLAPEALKRSRLKKKVAMRLYEGKLLRRANALQALSIREREDIRRLGLTAPVAVIPNGIDDSFLHRPLSGQNFQRKHGLPDAKKTLLFLARLDPIKGLDLLLPLLAEDAEFRLQWCLVLAGPITATYRDELQEVIRRYQLEEYVRLVGPLFGQDKLDAYDACDAFVLPSRSEAMPMVVLEAMARGKPVLVTEATPIEEITTHRAGIKTGFSLQERATGLAEFLRLPPEELRRMGAAGRMIVEGSYRWGHIANMTHELYAWLLGHRSVPPDFVSLVSTSK